MGALSVVLPIVINYTKLPEVVTYAAGPPEVFTPANISIPDTFANHLVVYCLAQVAMQDDDFNKYSLLMNQFKSGVIDLKEIRNSEDLYPFISVSPRDQGEWY